MSDDRLSLLGMRFQGRHGVLPDEKVTPQPFEVDVVLRLDLSEPAATDDLRTTVDYANLFDLVRAVVEGPSFDLIEALAGAISSAVLAATDPERVSSVEVRVRKPEAPIEGDFETVEVALVRGHPDRR
jgi:dihydroneopterin aldolase